MKQKKWFLSIPGTLCLASACCAMTWAVMDQVKSDLFYPSSNYCCFTSIMFQEKNILIQKLKLSEALVEILYWLKGTYWFKISFKPVSVGRSLVSLRLCQLKQKFTYYDSYGKYQSPICLKADVIFNLFCKWLFYQLCIYLIDFSHRK